MSKRKLPIVLPDGAKVYCAHTKIEQLGKLKPNPRNPNRHPDAQLRLIGKILRKAWRYAIVVSDRSGMIVKGHGRLAGALLEGLTHAPIDVQHYESEAEEIADLIADNRLAELAYFERGELKDLLLELDTGAFDMDFTGYDTNDLEEMMTAAPPDTAGVKQKITVEVTCPQCGHQFTR